MLFKAALLESCAASCQFELWRAFAPMSESDSNKLSEQVIEAMIELAFISKLHRVIVTGSDSLNIYLGMHRRGFSRVTTTSACRIPCGQHEVALVAGSRSRSALESTLVRIVPFLSEAGVLVVWTRSQDRESCETVQRFLERLGFRVELGTSCDQGFILAARRHETSHLVKVA